MIKKVLLDTDVVIQLLRKDAETVSVFMDLLQTKVTLLLSPIVVAEIYAGAYPREYVDIALFEFFVPVV